MMDRHLRNRYSRQTMLPSIGEEGQQKLIASGAVVIGCGALGSHIATLLVRAGVGKVRIVDRDFIEEHNLQRQVLFDEEDIKAGLPKAIAAEAHLRKANSSVEVEGIVADVNYTNIEKLCSGADVILDGLDNAGTRFLINDVSLKHKIPWVYGGAIATTGMTMTIVPGRTPCLRCISPTLPDPAITPTCETAGILGTVPAVIGALQATEAMKLLINPAEINRDLVIIDAWKGTFDRLHLERRPDCPACRGKYEFLAEKFHVRTTSLCGQSRSIQVVDTRAGKIDLKALAARLRKSGEVSGNSYMLGFGIDDKEILVFPDGRAIVKGTLDEAEACDLYYRYVASSGGK
ncbi:MAG TPA: ThiF family adenylyltransferase [Dehalococcoidales bacterium]|nr:ThiF family adenylyltransferase [Dehalococcoidales bacterium]